MTPSGIGPSSGSPSSTTEVTKQEGSAVASTVKEQTSQTTHVAQQGGQQVAAEAREQISQLTQQAQHELHRVMEQAQQELNERASEQTDKVATELRGLAGEFRALTEGRVNDAPRAAQWLDHSAEQANHYASRLEQRGFVGVVEDVSRFARRRPGLFLLGAIVTGFATGRLVRGAQKANESDIPEPPAEIHNGSVQSTPTLGSAPTSIVTNTPASGSL